MMEQKLTAKNYIGYALCDVSGMLAFSALGAYLSVFYTDILKISTGAVFVIMLVARLWDGINDPIMGFLAQRRTPGAGGKFRPFLIWGGIPLAVASVLTMTYIPGLSQGAYVAYAAGTYILYGMLYTVVLVPYGSMASVMTRRENERSILSMCRSVGGGVGSLPATMLFPLLVFTDKTLDAHKLFIAMCIICIAMIVLYTLSFRWTREYIPSPPSKEHIGAGKVIASLLKNRAFVIMSIIGCLLMASSMYLNTINVYIFKDYYGKAGLLTLVTVASYLPMLAMIPFVNKLISAFGKKSISIAGLAISTVTMLLVWLLRFRSPWAYIAACFFLNLGTGFLTLEVWAMAMDVIDAQELQSGRREEAISYSVFTFMRKVGQALAALAPLLVGLVGYDSDLVGTGQNAATLEGMYTVATLVPCIMYAVMLVLMIIYPLGKKEMEEMHAKLRILRASEDKS
jgi:glycoside/pentoside/hexuronide:cation symporter, GPH family